MGYIEQHIEDSISEMPWLTGADQAAVALALQYAEAIDTAVDSGDANTMTKALYLGPHLLNTLSALGATPAGRRALELREETRGKLATVRDLRDRQKPSKKRATSAQ